MPIWHGDSLLRWNMDIHTHKYSLMHIVQRCCIVFIKRAEKRRDCGAFSRPAHILSWSCDIILLTVHLLYAYIVWNNMHDIWLLLFIYFVIRPIACKTFLISTWPVRIHIGRYSYSNMQNIRNYDDAMTMTIIIVRPQWRWQSE